MKTILIILLATASLAHATFIDLGQVTFTGDFTRNPLYDFQNPGATFFGTFTDQTVLQAGGIFSPYIQSGAVLDARELWTNGPVPIFTIGGFTLATFPDGVGIYGVGFVAANVTLTGNGFTPPDNFFADWFFEASTLPGSQPMTLTFNSGYDNGHVPDTGSTIALMSIALLGLILWKPLQNDSTSGDCDVTVGKSASSRVASGLQPSGVTAQQSNRVKEERSPSLATVACA